MSHNIQHFTYPENVNKKKVEADLNNYVAHEGWLEGTKGLDKPIRWLDVICDSEADAYDFIKQHDRGWYDSLAVRFHDMPHEARKSKKMSELRERLSIASVNYRQKEAEILLSKQKSEYVSCKKCGSRLNRAMLIQRFGTGSNFCPICKADLRSPTALKAIAAARERYQAISKQLEEEERKAAKASKVIKWLVKIEYHT